MYLLSLSLSFSLFLFFCFSFFLSLSLLFCLHTLVVLCFLFQSMNATFFGVSEDEVIAHFLVDSEVSISIGCFFQGAGGSLT